MGGMAHQPLARQDRYGPGGTLRPGAIWQAWSDVERTVRAVHGRHGSTRVGTLRRARQVRQRIDGPRVLRQATLRWARIPRFGIPRQATHGTAWPFGARQTRPDTASTATVVSDSHGRHGLATHPMNKARQATQRSAGTPAQGRHGFQRHGQTSPGLAGSAAYGWYGLTRHGRLGNVWSDNQGLAWLLKSRQEWCC
jgi:hypothetical protein